MDGRVNEDERLGEGEDAKETNQNGLCTENKLKGKCECVLNRMIFQSTEMYKKCTQVNIP